VPIVYITLFFEAHDGESLFVDPAHPNQEGHRVIADALWPAVERLVWSLPDAPA
jgi:lysophospholipase L1-like esterase